MGWYLASKDALMPNERRYIIRQTIGGIGRFGASRASIMRLSLFLLLVGVTAAVVVAQAVEGNDVEEDGVRTKRCATCGGNVSKCPEKFTTLFQNQRKRVLFSAPIPETEQHSMSIPIPFPGQQASKIQ